MASSISSPSSSTMADDSVFSDRVKKTFGSLFASLQPSPTPSSSSLWSPAADVPKKEWRRNKDTSARDSTPCSSSFNQFLHHPPENDVVSEGIDDWDVRSTIGLDPTLDNEEEEDTFDKVAVGRENADDRLYMRDVIANHDVDFKSEDERSGTVRNRQRDPRANLLAAKIRLNEDDAEVVTHTEKPEAHQQAPGRKPSTAQEDSDKLKPILKRKEHETTTTKASKRVRFDPECLSASETVVGDIAKDNNASGADEKLSRVPDYVQNPSKYTRYSLDSVDDMCDKSNSGTFFDCLEMVRKAKNGDTKSKVIDAPPTTELPKSVTFVPKKKSDIVDKPYSSHSETSQDRQSDGKSFSIQPNLLDLGVGDMDVDEPKESVDVDGGITFKKQGRQYRSKPRTDDEEEA